MQVISRMTRSNTYRHNVCRQLAICTAHSVVQQWFEVNSNHKYTLYTRKCSRNRTCMQTNSRFLQRGCVSWVAFTQSTIHVLAFRFS